MEPRVVLEGATIVTGRDGEVIERGKVIIEGEKITCVEPTSVSAADSAPSDAVNAQGMTIIPGLIDTHIHLVGNGEVSVFVNLFESSMHRAVKSIRYLRDLLSTGITTVRSGGDGNDFFEMALRDGINEGYIEGPRLLATGYHLTATGGHAYFLPPWTDESNCVGMRCDGPDGFRKGARLQLAHGADSVKMTSGRGLEERDDARIAELTVDEMRAAVDEAHRRGKLAIAHAIGPEAIANAISAGVDSIVHGFWLDDACAEKMIGKGIYWEPTVRYPWRIMEDNGRSGTPAFYVRKCSSAVEALQQRFLRYANAGVKIVLGSDAGGVPLFYHGENAQELDYMVRLGMDPLDAIIAATRHSAECLRLDSQVGTLEPGKQADILIVRGNPLKDIAILAQKDRIMGVLKAGQKAVWEFPVEDGCRAASS